MGINHIETSLIEARKSRKAERQLQAVGLTAFVALAQSEMVDDTTITENADLFCVWDENWTGHRGSIVFDDGALFRSIHDVGSGQATRPSETPSMWTRIGNPGDEWPEWSQPLGAHDAYPLGAQVTHNGSRWTSDLDNNIWEPGVFAWTAVT